MTEQRRPEDGRPRPVDETRRHERERRQRGRPGGPPPRVRDEPAPPRRRDREASRSEKPVRDGGGRGRHEPVRVRDSFRVTGADPAGAWEPSAESVREFELDGRTWQARTTGNGVYGTGASSLARLDAVRFFAPGATAPAREAMLPAGSFENLYEDELRDLFGRATDVSGAERSGP